MVAEVINSAASTQAINAKKLLDRKDESHQKLQENLKETRKIAEQENLRIRTEALHNEVSGRVESSKSAKDARFEKPLLAPATASKISNEVMLKKQASPDEENNLGGKIDNERIKKEIAANKIGEQEIIDTRYQKTVIEQTNAKFLEGKKIVVEGKREATEIEKEALSAIGQFNQLGDQAYLNNKTSENNAEFIFVQKTVENENINDLVLQANRAFKASLERVDNENDAYERKLDEIKSADLIKAATDVFKGVDISV